MSHFAKVLDGKVIQVIVAESNFFSNYIDTTPGAWIKTSYNTRGGVHYDIITNQPDGGIPLRGNYAGIGDIYDQDHDVFYGPQPFSSWYLDQTTWLWHAPIPMPTDGQFYLWDESVKNWIIKN